VRSTTKTEAVAYATVHEWLEGKRRLVQVLRRLSGGEGEEWRPRRESAPALDREVLVAAMNWHEVQHRQSTELAREAGVKLPIDQFAAEHELDDVEREVVEILLVAATDLTRDGGYNVPVAELVRLLTRGRTDSAYFYLPYFLPNSHLCSVVRNREGFGGRRLGLDDETVAALLGVLPERPQSLADSVAVESWHGDIAEFLSECGVVLNDAALESIRALWGFVRQSDVINDKWGFGTLEQVPTGVCLLFHGPSGTGKTLTAKSLCRALGRRPLVVSYADLVSKWVGETQKNTKAAFAEAARTGRALIFDEADAIFAQRTAVQSSCDRLMNSEVNTLLMELEQFPGVVILTTNHADVLDPALERRIRYKVFFGAPEAEARGVIWRVHLPDEAPVAPDVDFDRLAHEFELTGGQIANAVLSAASLAASRLEEGSAEGEITMADFEAAAKQEARGCEAPAKSGRLGF